MIALAAQTSATAGRAEEAVKPPIGFVYGNCVFADALDDGWAAFAVETESYEWLSEDGKRARFLALLGALEAIEADVQILRVGRRWDWSATRASWKTTGWRRAMAATRAARATRT